jgi:ferrous-iron efflux pump FieF
MARGRYEWSGLSTFAVRAASASLRESPPLDGSSQSPQSVDPASVREAHRITAGAATLSVAVAILLVALKGGAWIFSGSVAMLASLADSTLDLAASLFTFFALRYAATPPDREHRFGHGKAEAFAALFQAGLVAVSGTLIAVEAVRRLASGQLVEHGGAAIGVMLLSMLLTGGLVLAQTRAVARTGSVAVKGDRAHYAADLAGNAAVIIGIAGSAFLNLPWADAVAGLVVAAWLGWGAWQVAREAADHLLDHELPEADRARIKALALEDSAIGGVHGLRTRSSGSLKHIQFHADIDGALTLHAAHEIIVAAEARIRAAYPGADIIIHPDPHDATARHGHEFFAGEGRADG